ncbi:MAG: hypothetical protein LC730_01870, partial [Acidobacteria bacterium]|nr:hypothetical protein [Acidobacteriota bacterium]
IDALCDLDNLDTLIRSDHVDDLSKRIAAFIPFASRADALIYPFIRRRVRLQREGVRRVDGISYYTKGISPRGDQLIREIMGEKRYRRLEVRGFPTDTPSYAAPGKDRKVFRLLNFTRISFLNEQFDNKRNDVMINGIGQFFDTVGQVDDVEVTFFRKGNPKSIDAAQEMAERLGFANVLRWREPVAFNELFETIVPESDVVFDQFGSQWMGAGVYAMLVGRPVIANERPEIFAHLFEAPSPVCQAKTPEEVAKWLVHLYKNRDEVERIGKESRTYIQKNFDIGKTLEFFMQPKPRDAE